MDSVTRYEPDITGNGYEFVDAIPTMTECETGPYVTFADYARLRAENAALRKDVEYYKWRLTAIIPLFQEARDALTAIPLASAKLRGLDLTLADRMDRAGTATRADFDAAMEQSHE